MGLAVAATVLTGGVAVGVGAGSAAVAAGGGVAVAVGGGAATAGAAAGAAAAVGEAAAATISAVAAPLVAAGPLGWIALGAEDEGSFDCWRKVVHDYETPAERGRPLHEIITDPRVVEVRTEERDGFWPQYTLKNQWGELFRVDYGSFFSWLVGSPFAIAVGSGARAHSNGGGAVALSQGEGAQATAVSNGGYAEAAAIGTQAKSSATANAGEIAIERNQVKEDGSVKHDEFFNHI
ncbi:hypothetical protein WR25_14621 [Diploscapter pachys]|uniref:Uncharacterized protein n=1 Tax=Diploscapter pachys TaxID=2018661 RepID=A0A2A2LFB1_9BILA|nr:hypothetical protein WR25_14621 [Diploscapter pachys]